MNILITGGLGYIGSHLIAQLKNKNYSIYVLDNLSNSKISTFKILKKLNKNLKELKIIDLKNKKKLLNYFKYKKFNIVIHMASYKSVSESFFKLDEYYKNNILGFVNLIEAMEKFKVNKLIFSSSATVYAPKISSAIKENDNLYANNIYSFTKKTIEDLIFLKNKIFKFDYVILRYFNPAGCHKTGLLGEDNKKVPNNLYPFIGSIIQKKHKYLKIYGKNYKTSDGTGARDYIHIEDLADTHLESLDLLKKKKNVKEILNIGCGKPITVKAVINSFKKYCNYKIKFKYYPRREGDLDKIYTDNKKAKKIFNWKPKKDLREIAISTYNYYKK